MNVILFARSNWTKGLLTKGMQGCHWESVNNSIHPILVSSQFSYGNSHTVVGACNHMEGLHDVGGLHSVLVLALLLWRAMTFFSSCVMQRIYQIHLILSSPLERDVRPPFQPRWEGPWWGLEALYRWLSADHLLFPIPDVPLSVTGGADVWSV